MVDQDFLPIFLDEAAETLAQWEAICLAMENVAQQDDVDALFRAAHNLKGSSRSVGLEAFSEFVHVIEDTLTALKKDLVLVTPPVIAIFLECQTILLNWIEAVKTTPDFVPDTEKVRQRLAAIIPNSIDIRPSDDGGLVLFDESSLPIVEVKSQNIGDILIENGHATQEQVDDAVKLQTAKLGSILIAQGVTSQEAVKEALEIQKQQGMRIDETIRVGLQKLDTLIRLMGELSIQHSIVSNAKEHGHLHTAKVGEAISLTSKVIQDLQTEAMALRMQPVDSLFKRLERVARDVARSQNKHIKISLSGENVEMDKTVLEKMKDPLVHIIRNAVDHGIESEDDRIDQGKSPIATLSIEAVQTATNVRITIAEDGRGLNREKILEKAIRNGLIRPDQRLSNDEIDNLIFLPGFSTAERVTDVSGRGVGMDVVRSAVAALRGGIEIQSENGRGTSFIITLPISLSVLDAIIVNLDDVSYAVPVQDILEVVDLTTVRLENSGGAQNMMNLRGKVMPLERLDSYLPNPTKTSARSSSTIALVTGSGKNYLALAVDSVVGQQSVVVRSVEEGLNSVPGFSGATILANGDPAMIIQLPHILKSHQRLVS